MRQLSTKKNPALDTKVDKSDPVISNVLKDSRIENAQLLNVVSSGTQKDMYVGNTTNLDYLYLQTKTIYVGVHTILERLSTAETNISTNGKIVFRDIYSADVAIATPTTINIATPSDCKRFICCILRRAWPTSSWANGAICTMSNSYEQNGTIRVNITTNSPQTYSIIIGVIMAI